MKIVAVAVALMFAAPARAESPAPFTVCIQPLGAHEARLLPIIGRGVEHLYGVDTRILPARRLPAEAYYKPRRRYRAEKLLAYMDRMVVPKQRGCSRVIGFTKVDISTSKPPHKDWGIFGLATLGGPSGVVSTFRLKRRAGRALLARRAVKVINHELGHTLGAEHIARRGCLMEDGAATIKTVDRESGLLCDETRAMIARQTRLKLPDLAAFDWPHVIHR